MELTTRIQACRICAERFAATATAHVPRPVAWFGPKARLLIAGQAPGARVHASGRPFTDASGDRLRDWLGLEADAFYDRERVAIVPMAFCFPGYDANGADLPPPRICAETWRAEVMAALPRVQMTVLVGGAAMGWQLGKGPVAGIVADWQAHAVRGIWPLPHPSWRNTGWLRRNPWFEADVVPALRLAAARVMG
jgi:uracil-DNA glycosylase